MNLDTELDRLFQLPLSEFTSERNALVKRLRAEDRSDDAKAVLALRKPPVSAWAVNRLAQLAPDLLAELREAGEALRSAQQQGHGHRQALAARRQAVTSLVARAEELLSSAGHGASSATLLRLTKTLEAIAVYGKEGPDPPAGRLCDDLEPPGIEALTVFGVAPLPTGPAKRSAPAPSVPLGPRRLPAAPAPPPAKAPSARQRARAREDLAAAKARLSERRREVRRAGDRLRRAESVQDQASRALGEAEQALEKARQRLAEASVTTRSRRSEAEEAAAELRRAEEAVEAAQQALARLQA